MQMNTRPPLPPLGEFLMLPVDAARPGVTFLKGGLVLHPHSGLCTFLSIKLSFTQWLFVPQTLIYNSDEDSFFLSSAQRTESSTMNHLLKDISPTVITKVHCSSHFFSFLKLIVDLSFFGRTNKMINKCNFLILRLASSGTSGAQSKRAVS